MAEVGQWNAALTSTKDIIRPRFCLDMVCTAMTLEARINIQRNNRGECLIQETYLAEQVRRQHPPQKIVTSVPSSSQHTPSPPRNMAPLAYFFPSITDLIKPNPGTTVAVTEDPWNDTAMNPRNRMFQVTKNNNTKTISQSIDREIFIVATVLRMETQSGLGHYNCCTISETNILKCTRIDVVWRQPQQSGCEWSRQILH